MARNYTSIASVKTLTADALSTATEITLNNLTNLPSAPYVLVLNPDTALEEAVLVTSVKSGTTLYVTRNIEGGGAQNHSTGNEVRHMIVGSDLQLSNDHIVASTAVHGLGSGVSVVGTSTTQTLTNKTLTSPKVNENVVLTATSTELNVLDGITATTAELNTTDGVTSPIQAQIDAKAPLASPTFTGTVTLPTSITGATGAITSAMIVGTLSGKTLSGPTISGSASVSAGATISTNSVTVSDVELGYLDGVTGAIQTQLDGKLSTSGVAADSYKVNGKTYTVLAGATGPTSPATGDVWITY
jgi:hypothetical protein